MSRSERAIDEKKRVFSRNVRCLSLWLGMSLREIADESGLRDDGYAWLRRAVRNGIHGPARTNKSRLTKLRRFFEDRLDFRIDRERGFWDPNLAKTIVGRELFDNDGLQPPSEDETVRRFVELLQSGRLRLAPKFIADLHRLTGVDDSSRPLRKSVFEVRRFSDD